MLVSSLISLSKSFSLRLTAGFDFSGLRGGARAELNVDDRTDGVDSADTAGDAWRSGAAEPARRTGCRKPDLLVVGRVEGGLGGPGIMKIWQLKIDNESNQENNYEELPFFFQVVYISGVL
jgi:hypothetical protein